jgi:hypothetical protein
MRKMALVGTMVWGTLLGVGRVGAADLELRLPLRRTAYQTNEKLSLAVIRSATNADLPAVKADLDLRGADGSVLHVVLPLPFVAAATQGVTVATEHVGLDARLLRPAAYELSVTAGGLTATQRIDVCSHIRKTPFRLIDWGGSGNGAEQALAGENGTGINLQYASWNGFDQDANIRGGIDFMRNCTMGGGHQMDGRQECDWSDPYVLVGGNARVARQALFDRTSPNTIGVHFYDEPGLTWGPHPVTGVFGPNNIPAQDWAFKAAFGTEAMPYTAVKTNDAASMSQWEDWLRWKQVFMESAGRNGTFAVNYVDPRLITATQSMYAWYAFGDGYYANIARAFPVMSGHGGYDDLAGGFLCPGFFFEFGRARDFNKPVWYLPQWWAAIPSPVYRLEQYLTFMMGPQGIMISPASHCEAPGLQPQSDALLESNRLMARLGTIFTTMPLTRPDVAVLYSMSQNAKAMADSQDMVLAQDFPGQVERLLLLYTAAKMAHIPIFPVVEEDILDGTVAANHKVLIMTGIERLDPKVVASLEAWIAGGGKVIQGDECKVRIAGAVKLGAEVHNRLYAEFKKFIEDPAVDPRLRREQAAAVRSPLAYYREGKPIAAAFAARCRELGVKPVIDCDEQEVMVSRHAYGDVEYLFLVNAATEAVGVKDGKWNSVRACEARVVLPDDGRPVYDAVLGGDYHEFQKDAGGLTAKFRFGPGEIRIIARTARPLGALHLRVPVVGAADYTSAGAVRSVAIRAGVADAAGTPLNAVLPLGIRVTDPLGAVRYDLYRATEGGELRLDLPLAVNDPSGSWSVAVRDLVSGKESKASFSYQSPSQAGSVAGLIRRAVYFAADYDAVFRFFRVHRSIALIPGTNPWEQAQAERLATDLKRWGIQTTIIAAGTIVKKDRPRELWRTWSGARGNPDFDMPCEAAVLIGSAAQHPLILTMLPGRQPPFQSVLPYWPEAGVFPGQGRGMLAWQTDSVGFNNYETITLIADDAAGMAEAAGTLFEMASGYRPTTDWELPAVAAVSPASRKVTADPVPGVVAATKLADRAVGLEAMADGSLLVLGQDGTLTRRAGDGKTLWTKIVEPVADGVLRLAANPEGSLIAVATAREVTAMDGEGRELFRFPMRFQSLLLGTSRVDPVTCLAVAPDGSRVAAGTLDGRMVLFDRKGRTIMVAGGMTPEEHAAWLAEKKAWDSGKDERENAKKVAKEEKATYDAAMAVWQAKPPKERGPAPKAPAKQSKVPPQPKVPMREGLRTLTFSADSKTLLALSDVRGRLIQSVDGRELAVVEGIGGAAESQAIADRFHAPTVTGDRVRILASADGSILGEVGLTPPPPPPSPVEATLKPGRKKTPPPARKDLPRDRVAAIRSLPDGLLMARAQEGALRRYKADGREAWVSSAPAVVKRMDVGKDCVAVTYWGGLIRILDLETGRVLAVQTYETDIAATVWLGNDLFVALADGRLLKLNVPR